MKKGLMSLILLVALVSMAFAGTPLVPPTGASPAEAAAWKASLTPRSANGALDYADRLCNSLVCVQIGETGMFNFGTADGRSLLYYYPNDPGTSHIIIAVDGMHYELGSSMCDGGATFDGWTDDGNSIVTNYTLLGYISISVTHTPVLFTATTGAILTRTVATNNDPTGAQHTIGVMYEYDTTVDGDDAAQLYFGPDYVTTETCFDAPYAYPYWDAIPSSGGLVGRGTITGGAAVSPDHIAYGQWGHFVGVCWNEACTGSPYGDSAVRYLWDEAAVNYGASRNVATYYGVGQIDVTPGVLSIGAIPPALECVNNTVTPNPYQVVVNITNNGGSGCEDIHVALGNGTGPGGTSVVATTNPVVIPFLGAGQNQTVTFTVQGSFTATGGCINAPIAVTSAGCEPNGTDICVNVPVCSSTQCSMPYTSVDMGNLLNACYPTLTNNPGHALTGVAWLGPQITGETDPHLATDEASRDCFGFGRDLPSLDPGTDGVAFFGAPWMPCTQVTVAVMVTGGPNYAEFLQNGGHLYLSAWKNGNYPNDADFDDELCGGAGSEWLIHDAIVTPSPIPYLFTFMDPGVFDHGIYRGVFRFRLGSHEFGRYGYGTFVADPEHGCPVNMANDINGGFDCVGEVEDYDMCDFQLAVELTSFNANPADGAAQLSWTTASEAQNDHFEIMRDGQAVAQIRGAGHSTTSLTYNYTDNGLTNGNSYNYSVVAVDINGGRQQLSTASVTPIAGAATVTEFALSQNFPNPFNPTTSISFDLPTGSFVSLKVFNMVGQEVASLVNGNLAQGRHSISFDAKDLPSGLYIYRMNAGSFNATKKMLLMK